MTPRERWGTCCPSDPNCEHSFLDIDELRRWLDTPISDEMAVHFIVPVYPEPSR